MNLVNQVFREVQENQVLVIRIYLFFHKIVFNYIFVVWEKVLNLLRKLKDISMGDFGVLLVQVFWLFALQL